MGKECPLNAVTIGFLVIFSYRVPSCLRSKNTIFHVENLVQQSVNATSSPSVTRKQLLLVLNCNSHLSCLLCNCYPPELFEVINVVKGEIPT